MAVDSWPRAPLEQIRRGDLVYLPTSVDGECVLRWVGPLRVGLVTRGVLDGQPYAVVRWAGGGPLALTGRLYAAGALRSPKEQRR